MQGGGFGLGGGGQFAFHPQAFGLALALAFIGLGLERGLLQRLTLALGLGALGRLAGFAFAPLAGQALFFGAHLFGAGAGVGGGCGGRCGIRSVGRRLCHRHRRRGHGHGHQVAKARHAHMVGNQLGVWFELVAHHLLGTVLHLGQADGAAAVQVFGFA